MKLASAMNAWIPPDCAELKTAGTAFVDSHPDTTGWSRVYMFPAGSFAEATDAERVAMLFNAFHTMAVRDGIDPQLAHEALLQLAEYRWAISPDIEGAEFWEAEA
jgi:hypothetical protein